MLCGNNTKMINATQEKRGAYDTTGIVKPEIRATNNDTWQTDKSKIRPEEPEQKVKTKQNMTLLQQLIHNCTTLSKKEIKEIASSEEEETDEETRHLQSGKEKEIATETENEPVIDESPDKLLNEDWEVFDSLDK